MRRYVHLGTGNYNPSTARVYTDLGLFTSDQDMADEVSALFNFLTGYSQNHDWQKLIIAPQDLHRKTLEFIDGQAEQARRLLADRGAGSCRKPGCSGWYSDHQWTA